MAIPGVAHIEVFALDALITPALLRRVLTGGGRLARDVALGVVATVTLLSCDWVTSVTVAVTLTSETRKCLREISKAQAILKQRYQNYYQK